MEIIDAKSAETINNPHNVKAARLDDLPRDRAIHLYCAVGLRSYIACRILEQNGFDARNMPGGYITYRAVANSGQLR